MTVLSYESSHVGWSVVMILVSRQSWCLLLDRFLELLCKPLLSSQKEQLKHTSEHIK